MVSYEKIIEPLLTDVPQVLAGAVQTSERLESSAPA